MIKAIIVDDEEKGGMALNNLLKKNCANVEVIEICDSVENAVVVINKHNPDLIFLDIEMPFKNGFALFENFKTPSFEVIFTTAYDHYAIKAIKYSAMDYLLKPVDTDELIVAVSKVELKIVDLMAKEFSIDGLIF